MEKVIKHNNLNLAARKNLTLDGVSNIVEFDGSYISLELDGELVKVEGEGMKVESLSKDDGTILISGKINGIYYTEEKSIVGFWKRLFG